MSLKRFMIDSANILFDDSKNDLRALPKTVRLQILLVLSFIWSVVFSLYIFSYTTFIFGWAGVFLAHAGIIFAAGGICVDGVSGRCPFCRCEGAIGVAGSLREKVDEQAGPPNPL